MTPSYKDYAPYQAAIAEERTARDFAYLDVPRRICGVAVRAMSLRDLITRLQIDCAFMRGRVPTAGEIGAFIWHVSIARSRAFGVSLLAEYHAKRKVITHIAGVAYEDALREINEYIDYTFLDAPAGTGRADVPVTSIAAVLIDRFAHEYGWSEAAILDVPLVRLYQQLREIQRRHDPKVAFPNRRSDKARGDYLRAINSQHKIVPFDPNFAVAQIRSAIRARRNRPIS